MEAQAVCSSGPSHQFPSPSSVVPVVLCQTVMCPQVDEKDVCSSHGECMSMARLAEAANLNGDATPYTYGAQTHRASTWDSNSMFGCKCDEGYHGYDCSLSTCQSNLRLHSLDARSSHASRCMWLHMMPMTA